MSRKHRSRSRRSSSTSRRGFLFKLGAGAAAAGALGIGLTSTRAFSSVTFPRNSTIGVAADGSGLIGFVDQGPVQKNTKEAMAAFTNNAAAELTITVELDTNTDGTLYDNVGGSGSSVTFSIPPGSSRFVDIEAVVEGVIPYSVHVSSSSFDLETTGSVESVGGNPNEFVRVSNVQEFEADSGVANEWRLGQAVIEDRDDDDDLDHVEYDISDSDGITRATRTDTGIDGQQHSVSDITIDPDDASYDLIEGETYALTVTGYDVDGNFDSETVEADAVGGDNDPSAIQFDNVDNFQANENDQNWTIDQVQFQDADNDDDLDRVEYEISDSSDTVRATREDSVPDAEYQEQDIEITPDDSGYTIPSGETYMLTVMVFDADGNFATETREATS